MKMEKQKKTKRIKASEILLLIIIILLLFCEFCLSKVIINVAGKTEGELINMLITRLLGGAAFLILAFYCKYELFSFSLKDMKYAIVAFIVALNNLPFLSLLSGKAVVDAKIYQILLLFFECMAVGFFEECAFRGFVLPAVMEKRRKNTKDIFVSVLITSGVFAIVHLINIFTSSPAAVILQIGYSFLIGAMCAVVFLYTGNILVCVFIHGLFNFMGAIVPTYGHGLIIWDHVPTIVITVIIGVIAAVFYIFAFIKYDVNKTERLYKKKQD